MGGPKIFPQILVSCSLMRTYTVACCMLRICIYFGKQEIVRALMDHLVKGLDKVHLWVVWCYYILEGA